MGAVAAVAVLLSYLGGSISFPYWVARLRGVDLRTVGSRKLGGSNLWKSVGPVEGTIGGALAAAEGLGPRLAARAVGLPPLSPPLCGGGAAVAPKVRVFSGFHEVA